MAQALALGQQGGLLGRLEPGRVDGRDQLLEVGALALGRLAPGPGRRQGALEAGEPPAQHPQAVRGRDDGRAREGVEHRELAGRPHQAPVLVLGGEAHQRAGERRHGVARGGLAVDQGPRAALGRHAARDDDLALVLGQLAQAEGRVVVLEPVPEALGDREGGLHERLARAGADGGRVGGRAGQQAERLGQDRLARAGLPGDGRQAPGRRQLGPLDDHEVADLERADHDRPNFSR